MLFSIITLFSHLKKKKKNILNLSSYMYIYIIFYIIFNWINYVICTFKPFDIMKIFIKKKIHSYLFVTFILSGQQYVCITTTIDTYIRMYTV